MGLLGLAQKAGKLVSGENNCIFAVKSLKAKLVILAEDSSFNTEKLFKDKCAYRDIPLIKSFDKPTLGRIIGKDSRAVIAVMDQGFCDALLKLINQ